MTGIETIEVPPEPVPAGWRSVLRNVQTRMPIGLQERRLDVQQWSYRRGAVRMNANSTP